MSTAAKVLIGVIAVFCIGFIYLAANVFRIQSAWRDRVVAVENQIKQAEENLATTREHNRETTQQLIVLQHGWGRTWHDVRAVPQGAEVTIERGSRDGLMAGELLYGFSTSQGTPLYLGKFQVVPNDLAENSAVISAFPEADAAANDPVEQQNLNRRVQRFAQAAGDTWVLRNDLPEGYKQQLLTWERLVKQQQYDTNAAQSDHNTWQQTLAASKAHLANREAELAQAVVAAGQADDQRNVEVRNRFETREALRRTVARLMEVLEQNRQLAQRIADLESQAVEAAGQ